MILVWAGNQRQPDLGPGEHHWDWLGISAAVVAVAAAGLAAWIAKRESDRSQKGYDTRSKSRPARRRWIYVVNILLAIMAAALIGLASLKSGRDLDRANEKIRGLIVAAQQELAAKIQDQSVGSAKHVVIEPNITTIMPQKHQTFGIFVVNIDQAAPVYDFSATVVTIDPNENQQPPAMPHPTIEVLKWEP